MAQKMGGLFVTVDADTKKALANIRQVSAAAKLASQNFDKLKRSAGGAGGNNMARGLDKVKKSSDQAGKSSKKAGDEFQKTGKKAQAAGKPLANLQASMYRLSQSFINLRYGNPLGVLAGLTQSTTSLSRAFSGLGGVIGKVVKVFALGAAAAAAFGAAVLAVAGAFAKFGLQSAVEIEFLTTQYQGLLGSAQKAAEEVQFILEMGKESVVPTEGLLEANRLLLAYGVTADGTRRKMLEFFSVFGSATGLSAARLQDMAYALGQINTQGRANQIDMRQLANAGLNLAKVYEEIAFQQGISVAAARELSSEGKLYAEVVIPAVLSQTKNYEQGAEAARRTARGILVNLKDIAKINIGRAFEGVLDKLKPILLWAEEFISTFDFTAVASGIGLAIDGIKIGLQDIDISAENAALSVGQGLGNAFRQVGIIAGEAILLARKATNLLSQFGESASLLILRLERAQLALERAGVAVGVAFGKRTQAELDAVDAKIRAVEDAAWDTYNQVDDLEAQLKALNGIKVEVDFIVRQRTIADQDKFNTLGAEGKSSKAQGLAYDYVPPVRENTSKNSSASGSKKVKDDAIDAKKYVDELGKALTGVIDLSTKPLGSASAIEQLFFKDGQGSTSKILSSFNSLSKGITDFFAPLIELGKNKKAKKALRDTRDAIVGELEAAYERVYYLAEKNAALQEEYDTRTAKQIKYARGRIAELSEAYDADVAGREAYYDGLIATAQKTLDDASAAYDAANSKLQDMLSARDAFLQGVRDSAYSFVNSLAETNETLSRVTELDGVGSFSSVQEQGTASFKAQLEERLAAVKKFRADIENLLSRGLDEGLLRQLVDAGPEEGAGLAAALAADSDAAIGEINALQSDLASTVGGLQSSLSAAWYDEDVSRQSAETARLLAQRDQAQANLDAIKVQRQTDLDNLKATYDEKVAQQEELITELEEGNKSWQIAIQKSIKANEEEANTIIKNVQEIVGKLGGKGPGTLYKLGKEAINGLIAGMDKRAGAAVAKAQSIAKQISDTIAAAFQINSPSRLMMGYGENISEGLAIGMENGISKVDMAAARVANAAMISGEITSGAPTVKVFIGDQELKDIVDVQITDASGRDFDVAVAGRRDF